MFFPLLDRRGDRSRHSADRTNDTALRFLNRAERFMGPSYSLVNYLFRFQIHARYRQLNYQSNNVHLIGKPEFRNLTFIVCLLKQTIKRLSRLRELPNLILKMINTFPSPF